MNGLRPISVSESISMFRQCVYSEYHQSEFLKLGVNKSGFVQHLYAFLQHLYAFLQHMYAFLQHMYAFLPYVGSIVMGGERGESVSFDAWNMLNLRDCRI